MYALCAHHSVHAVVCACTVAAVQHTHITQIVPYLLFRDDGIMSTRLPPDVVCSSVSKGNATNAHQLCSISYDSRNFEILRLFTINPMCVI